MNVMVGLLQVVTPTYLIFTAGGDPDVILAASGLYLFGFTYLYVAFNLFGDLDSTGLGYFSSFVAACAIVYSALNVVRLDDRRHRALSVSDDGREEACQGPPALCDPTGRTAQLRSERA